MKSQRILLLLVLAGITSAYAEGGFYTGAGLGVASLTNNVQGNFVLGQNNPGQISTDSGLGMNMYLGYDFNHYFGVQEEYDVAFNTSIADSYSANQQIFGTTLLMHLPFSLVSYKLSGLDAFAKGGVGYEVFQFSGNSGCPGCVNPAHQGGQFVPMYGAGLEYGLTNVGYRLEWDSIGSAMNNNQGVSQVAMSSNLYLFSIMYHF